MRRGGGRTEALPGNDCAAAATVYPVATALAEEASSAADTSKRSKRTDRSHDRPPAGTAWCVPHVGVTAVLTVNAGMPGTKHARPIR
jgi:hypothetical protein